MVPRNPTSSEVPNKAAWYLLYALKEMRRCRDDDGYEAVLGALRVVFPRGAQIFDDLSACERIEVEEGLER
jgi:hypothetical protein